MSILSLAVKAAKKAAKESAEAGVAKALPSATELAVIAPTRAPYIGRGLSREQQLAEDTLRMAATPGKQSYPAWRAKDKIKQGDLFAPPEKPLLRAPLGVRPGGPHVDLPRSEAA